MTSLRKFNLSKHFHLFNYIYQILFLKTIVAPVANKQTLQETTADKNWDNFQLFCVRLGIYRLFAKQLITGWNNL